MEPQSKLDCPIETPVFYPAETLPYEVTDILSGVRTSRRPARCGEPRNQSDCPAGTKFREGMPESTGGAYMRAIPAICVKSTFSDLFPKCGPETGTEPDGKGGCRPIGRPSSEPQPQPTKTMGVGSNWLFPAILVGVGIYMITRKSE